MKLLWKHNLKRKKWGHMAYYVPPSEKVGVHVPPVPHQIAPTSQSSKLVPNDDDSHKSSMYQNVQTCILEVNNTRIGTTSWHCILCKAVWSNYRPPGRMWPATAFSVTRGSIQEKSLNQKFVEKRVRFDLSHKIACAGCSAFAQEQRMYVLLFLCTIMVFVLFIYVMIKSEDTVRR